MILHIYVDCIFSRRGERYILVVLLLSSLDTLTSGLSTCGLYEDSYRMMTRSLGLVKNRIVAY